MYNTATCSRGANTGLVPKGEVCGVCVRANHVKLRVFEPLVPLDWFFTWACHPCSNRLLALVSQWRLPYADVEDG